MIDRSHALPVTRQAWELGISRSSIYYLPRPTSVVDLAIMRRLDELHMERDTVRRRKGRCSCRAILTPTGGKQWRNSTVPVYPQRYGEILLIG